MEYKQNSEDIEVFKNFLMQDGNLEEVFSDLLKEESTPTEEVENITIDRTYFRFKEPEPEKYDDSKDEQKDSKSEEEQEIEDLVEEMLDQYEEGKEHEETMEDLKEVIKDYLEGKRKESEEKGEGEGEESEEGEGDGEGKPSDQEGDQDVSGLGEGQKGEGEGEGEGFSLEQGDGEDSNCDGDLDIAGDTPNDADQKPNKGDSKSGTRINLGKSMDDMKGFDKPLDEIDASKIDLNLSLEDVKVKTDATTGGGFGTVKGEDAIDKADSKTHTVSKKTRF